MIWDFGKKILFQMDAETAHRLTLHTVDLLNRINPGSLEKISGVFPEDAPSPEVWGLSFRSPVGLAAGMDKDAEILTALPKLGFGFAEIGTVTPRPQPGNPRPRLFRDPKRQILFNRMGFNSAGAAIVSQRVAHAKPKLPKSFRVGVNIGKNKETDLDQAHLDYAQAIRPFEGLADYVVVNVSSPNTPGLRSLQTVESLKPIINAVKEVIERWNHSPPLLLKLAPELEGEPLKTLISEMESLGVSGWILTNTLAGEWPVKKETMPGGLSGAPLKERSLLSLQEVRSVSSRPIISVGGILDSETAQKRMKSGANLIQIYSGWVFHGPTFPVELTRALT